MKVEELIHIQFIRNNLPKLNESMKEELMEFVNSIEGCGNAVTKNTSLEDLMKSYVDRRLEKHSENDAKKRGIDKRKHFKDCKDGILTILHDRIKKMI